MIFKRLLAIVLIAVSSTFVHAQVEDPISWNFKATKVDGKKYEITIIASIEDGWHLYSTILPEGGPIPTTFTFKQTTDFKLDGKIKEITKSTKEHDEIFDLDLSYFAKEATFSQIVELTNVESTNIEGNVEYQACFSDKCIYLEKDFSINIGENAPTQTATAEPEKPEIKSLTFDVQTEKPIEKKSNSSLLVFFLISFAAGLAGLLTPCVFPMIPMTVSFFMNKQGNKLNAIINALVFGLSIIAIYTSIGLLVSLTNLGANFASQLTSHWITNLIFFILFVAFAASFFGLFEIVLPGSLANKTDSKADKGGFVGSFFMALTTVIVSLSCVGPIVGALLVEAASGLGAKPIIGMFGFSLAFAIPFTLFAIFPSWLNSLPRSGGWMNSVKVVLGFIVLAFSLKFLMIVDQTYHWGILGREVYLAIWISIFTMMGLYLLGKIKFKLDSELKHVGVFRLILAIASFAFVIYLIPGMIGAPLKSISGLLPPQSSHSFDLLTAINKSKSTSTIQVSEKSSLCEEPKYADILHLPHGLEGYFDYNQALACAKTQNKPLFIDFVGHSCSNCKEMEAKVWSDPRVLEKLRNNFVIVALYIDERKELPENEWVTSKVDGKVKKTVGKRNADMQISRFNINGQPYYVLLDKNEQTLVEPRGYDLDVEAFIKFLDNGIEEFKKRN
ncbi:MAG: protein-disulfide reductase DsbD family protein [Tenuifilaceae bacterium]